MIRLSLASVGMVEETASVILILRAAEQKRLLVMEVGLLEGRAVAMEAEGVTMPRPLTHELAHRVIDALQGTLTRVVISDFRDSTYYATLELRSKDGEEVQVDARPSDAIALALRAQAPIYVTEAVLAEAGMDEDETEDDEDLTEEVDEGDEEEPILH